jgi:hypothetical protein
VIFACNNNHHKEGVSVVFELSSIVLAVWY